MPAAIFDLDGCLSVSPSQITIPLSSERWDEIWNDDGFPSNTEIIKLLRGLQMAGWYVLILTGRPERYRKQTVRWLMRQGVSAPLIMLPDDYPRTIVEWKCTIIHLMLEAAIDLQFVVEDYKPNADVIRTLIPVLLYERKRA